jgi:hypothetical protein
MISGILAILGSSTIGSLLGGIFAFLNRKADAQLKHAEWQHELALRAADLQFAQQEALARHEVAIVEADSSIETARMLAIAAAQSADKIDAAEIKAAGRLSWMLVIASTANKLIRPIATFVLTAAAIYINMILINRLVDTWPELTSVQQLDSAMQAFAWITGQASAALGYWFVSRGTSKK